jgi:hypothetical protein
MTKFVQRTNLPFIPPPELAYLFPREDDDFSGHRLAVKVYLLSRDKMCLGCGEPLLYSSHMHEGLISRAEVRGWPEARRVLVMTPFNCVLVCPACNLGLDGKIPPSREQAFEYLSGLYGRERVLAWLRSLPFKVPPKWFAFAY